MPVYRVSVVRTEVQIISVEAPDSATVDAYDFDSEFDWDYWNPEVCVVKGQVMHELDDEAPDFVIGDRA